MPHKNDRHQEKLTTSSVLSSLHLLWWLSFFLSAVSFAAPPTARIMRLSMVQTVHMLQQHDVQDL